MHNISYYFTCVPSKDSDLTAHPKVWSNTSLFPVYLKGNEGPKNCGFAVLLEFSLEELAIVGNVQCKNWILQAIGGAIWAFALYFGKC